MAAHEPKRVTNRKWVAKCANKNYGEVYEALAYSMEARMMFFYSEIEKAIVCTNGCWKPSCNQNQEFANCSKFKTCFEKLYVPKSPPAKRTR